MHYRKIDLAEIGQCHQGREVRNGYMIEINGLRRPAELPADMLAATPWQDRDGDWYWRMEVRNS